MALFPEIAHVLQHTPSICLLERGLLSLEGPDTLRFLQGQITCDVTLLDPSEKTRSISAYCDPKGRIRSVFLIFQHGNRYILSMPKNILPPTIALFKKFGAFSKISITEQSDDLQGLGVYAATPPLIDPATSIIVSVHSDGPPRFEVYGPKEKIQALLKASSLAKISQDTWAFLEMKAGLPNITPETQEKIVAQYANLEALGALCHTKGCYSGQEIIARIYHRQVMKQGLYTAYAQTTQEIAPGTPLSPGGIVLQALPISATAQILSIVLPHTLWSTLETVHVGSKEGPALSKEHSLKAS